MVLHQFLSSYVSVYIYIYIYIYLHMSLYKYETQREAPFSENVFYNDFVSDRSDKGELVLSTFIFCCTPLPALF